MDTKTTTIATAVALAGLQIGLFAWLKTDIGALSERLVTVERDVSGVGGEVTSLKTSVATLGDQVATLERRVAGVESEVAFVRGQLSLALPALAQSRNAPPGDGSGTH